MLMPGPEDDRQVDARASCASAAPIRRNRSGFHAERDRRRRREAGRGQAAAEPDVVACPRLGAQAVRAVRHHDLRDAQPLDRRRVPERGTRRQRRLLLQGQLGQQGVDVEAHARSAFPRRGRRRRRTQPCSLPRPPPSGRAATQVSAAACQHLPHHRHHAGLVTVGDQVEHDAVDAGVEHPLLQIRGHWSGVPTNCRSVAARYCPPTRRPDRRRRAARPRVAAGAPCRRPRRRDEGEITGLERGPVAAGLGAARGEGVELAR